MDSTKIEFAICEYCGHVYERKSPRQHYCSPACRDAYVATHKIHDRDRAEKNAKNKKDIAQIAKLASEAHMTYGQYVAKHRL